MPDLFGDLDVRLVGEIPRSSRGMTVVWCHGMTKGVKSGVTKGVILGLDLLSVILGSKLPREDQDLASGIPF